MLDYTTILRGGNESVLSFYFNTNESNRLRCKLYHGNFKEKPTNSNSLKILIYKINLSATTERMQQHLGFLPTTTDKDSITPYFSVYYKI